MTKPKSKSKIFYRLPGFLLRWDLERVLEAGFDYRIEVAGTTLDGSELFTVYRRESDDFTLYRLNPEPRSGPGTRGKGALP